MWHLRPASAEPRLTAQPAAAAAGSGRAGGGAGRSAQRRAQAGSLAGSMSVSVNQLVDPRGRRKRLDSVELDEQVAESRSRESEREQALPRLSSSGSLRGTLTKGSSRRGRRLSLEKQSVAANLEESWYGYQTTYRTKAERKDALVRQRALALWRANEATEAAQKLEEEALRLDKNEQKLARLRHAANQWKMAAAGLAVALPSSSLSRTKLRGVWRGVRSFQELQKGELEHAQSMKGHFVGRSSKLLREDCTVWVGGIAEQDANERHIKQTFAALLDDATLGEPITNVECRVKGGENKSWALVTFQRAESAEAAVSMGANACEEEGGGAVPWTVAAIEPELMNSAQAQTAGGDFLLRARIDEYKGRVE